MNLSLSASIWFVIGLAFVAANLPFISQRLFGVLTLRRAKTLVVRLAELAVLYVLVGGAGFLLEQRAGQIAPQGWEFYVVTASLFATLAFPGFTWRYLVRRQA